VLIVQALGVGSVAVVVWHNTRDQSLGGHITAEMIMFAWHSELHNAQASSCWPPALPSTPSAAW
jgi:hypothetical protein